MKGLLTSLLTVLTFGGIQAQSSPATPRLVVGLTIDQLRGDYLEAFASLYGEGGFKRLWKEGRMFCHVEHTFARVDRASAIAAIHSGTTPSLNGIIGNEWMDTAKLRVVGSTDDPQFMGYYTEGNHAPTRLLASTIADELKAATQGKGLVYSIAPHGDAALFSAGHAADGAFWLNPYTGKWSGTTYYGEFPYWASQYNDRKAVDFRMSDIVWEPFFPRSMYTLLPDDRTAGFRHKFDNDRLLKYRLFLTSPLVNDEVNALAKEALTRSPLGVDDTTDFLALTYYAGNYASSPSSASGGMEIQDAYVRIDRSIAELLEQLDRKIGLQHVLFFLTSTGYEDNSVSDSATYKIPGGEFHLNRCAALLNMYLMATYGDGKYIETHNDNQIYLNHKLIEQKQLNAADVQEKCTEFLMQFSGVNEVYSAHRLLTGAWTPDNEKIRNGYHRKHSGDLIIEVLPGWTVVGENGRPDKTVRYASPPAPLVFMGSGIKPDVIRTPVTVDRIAPTVAHFLRIRAPNACKASPLVGLR